MCYAAIFWHFGDMCTLAIYFRAFADYPVIVAANRDEYLARPALPPTLLCSEPRVVGGKDLRANGTWLGINEHGIIAGLLNRRNGAAVNNPELRSRGLLCLDALRCRTAAEAAETVARQSGADYNPFNLLIASRDQSFVAYNRFGQIELVELTPGLHLLTNIDIDDFECPRISRSYGRFAALVCHPEFARDPVAHREELHRLLADHSTQLDPRTGDTIAGMSREEFEKLTDLERARVGGVRSLCVHLGEYGTCSSSLIFMGRDPGRIEHFFAPGAPCTNSYQPVVTPFQVATVSVAT